MATYRQFKRASAKVQNVGLSKGKSEFYHFFAYTDLRFSQRCSLFYFLRVHASKNFKFSTERLTLKSNPIYYSYVNVTINYIHNLLSIVKRKKSRTEMSRKEKEEEGSGRKKDKLSEATVHD